MHYQTKQGRPYPLGATPQETGINFSIFSMHTTGVTLSVFLIGCDEPFFTTPLEKTNGYWHVFIENLPSAFDYNYRFDGPYNEKRGDLFDAEELLIDPYAKRLNDSTVWGLNRHLPPPKGRFMVEEPFDWEDETPPQIAKEDLIIYEMHVRGFTLDPSSHVENRGTFLGIIEKIPYLKSLGVNAIELMPIHTFNESENERKSPQTGETLYNFWGYSTINFFCLMARFSTSNPITEFKQLVKALHKEKIELILDVVYNHTAEGFKDGPYYSFRGIDNRLYYQLDTHGAYCNASGCGNTVSSNQPVVERLILDSLHYFALEMRVDGFRFDLASALTRDAHGAPLKSPPLIEAISHDPHLSHKKLIAEAWDAGGLYQIGQFVKWGDWSEWNGNYRDTVRRFIKGTDDTAAIFANSLCGSDKLYKTPTSSINFITCHDGFTLKDLVSYQEKYNEANGENNQDGASQNDSWNCGVEGETNNVKIIALRARQMRNFHVALMLSLGTPMLFMGDEYGHSKQGNNNSYCHDNQLNYFLWDQIDEKNSFFRFYRLMIQLRKNHPILRQKKFFTEKDIDWHGHTPKLPNFGKESRFIAYTLKSDHGSLYIAFNAHFDKAHIQLPECSAHKEWYQIVDTARASPNDFIEEPQKESHLKETYVMESYSALIAKEF